MHVLLTADVVGGVWDFTWVLAGQLKARGHRVTLLAFGEPSALQRAQAAELGAWLMAAPLKLEWMQDSAADVRAAVAMAARMVRELRPDVLHANQFALATVPGVPVVLTLHSDVLSWLRWVDHAGKGTARPPEWSAYHRLVRRGIRQASAVVAVTDFLACEAAVLYGVRREIGVIHNGWPSDGYPDAAPVARRPRLTLVAGRVWDRGKNVCLAEAAAHGWDPGRVVLAGAQRNPETGGVAEVGDPLEALGHVSRTELDQTLGQARVYLSPARYDPFGLLPLQAALAGCPLLLSDVPSYRELWDGTALFFRSDDAADLQRQWSRLLADDRLAAELALRARQRALDRYSAPRMAEQYAALYATVGSRRPRAQQPLAVSA